MYSAQSARSSEEIRRRPEIYLRLNLKPDAKELLSLRSLVDSVMKSIESFTDFGSLYEDSIDRSESSMQEEGYGSLLFHVHCNMKLGIFSLAICLVFFQKAYKAPSIEALRQGKFAAARVEFMGFRVP